MDTVIFLFLRRMRLPLLIVLLAYAIAIGGLVLIKGEDDQGNVWYFDFLHALYFISYTATTIGFGELPYAFTPAQRLWTTFCFYLTTIGWLYAIGQTLALMQDPAFRTAITERRLLINVRRLRRPFYIVCGYGQTGSLLVRALARRGIKTVVIDQSESNLSRLPLDNVQLDVPSLVGDATNLRHLEEAGLESPWCQGVVAVTDSDAVNVKVAISARLLNPAIKVVARASSQEAVINLESFNTNRIVNPFNSFADHLAISIRKPNINRLHTTLGSLPGHKFPKPIRPPDGHWVIVGYGRCGKALERYFRREGIETTIIEPDESKAPEGAIIGRGVDSQSLIKAGIRKAAGIVAGTDNDANNLSIIVTAREQNADLYLVARQNFSTNQRIFDAANVDLVMDSNRIIVWRLLPFLTTPLLHTFLRSARHYPEEWAANLVNKIEWMSQGRTPNTWTITIDEVNAPALVRKLEEGVSVTLFDLTRDPRNRENQMACMWLVLRRGEKNTIMPEGKKIQLGDRLLIASRAGAEPVMKWLLEHDGDLHYTLTGEDRPDGWLWRRIADYRLSKLSARLEHDNPAVIPAVAKKVAGTAKVPNDDT
jgi:voltage-gated potassium channel